MLTDEEAAELAALRARAFGPDADIFDDPPGLARLRELEGRAHDESAPDASASLPAVGDAEDDSFDTGKPADAPSASEHRTSVDESGSPARATSVAEATIASDATRRTWNRRAVLLVGVPVVVAAAAIGAWLGAASVARPVADEPTPSTTLDAVYVPNMIPAKQLYSWDFDSPRLLANLAGTQVWDGTTAGGEMTCIIVFDESRLQPESACAATKSLTNDGVGVTVTDPRSRATRTYVVWPNGAPVLTWSSADPNPSP